MTRSASASSRYAQFLALAAAVVVALVAIGFVPTRRLAGEDGIAAMLAGCAIGFVSAACAGVLLVIGAADTPDARMKRSFLAMVARLGVAVALAVAVVLSGALSIQPLLVWIGIVYVVLLPLEVRLAIYG